MKPLILTAIEKDVEVIEVRDYQNTLLCEIHSTGEINVPDSFKFDLDEVKEFVVIAEKFRLFYNNNRVLAPTL